MFSFCAATKIIPDMASVYKQEGCGSVISATERSRAAPRVVQYSTIRQLLLAYGPYEP